MDGQHAGTLSHKVEHSLWEKIGTIDKLHHSHCKLLTEKFCGRQKLRIANLDFHYNLSHEICRFRIDRGRSLVSIRTANVRLNCLDVQKNPSAVSHSSAVSEIILLDAASRTEGVRVFRQGIACCETFSPHYDGGGNSQRQCIQRHSFSHSDSHNSLDVSDHLPSNVPNSSFPSMLYIFEDRAAVVLVVIYGRSSSLRHASRTHRVDVVWLSTECMRTTEQVADMLTKGSFTTLQWQPWMRPF